MEAAGSMHAVRDRIRDIQARFGPAPSPVSAAAAPVAFRQTLQQQVELTRYARTEQTSAPLGYVGLDNGRIPDHLLHDVGEGHRLHPAAAVQWNAMRNAMAAEGIDVPVSSSYRTYEQQADLVDRKGRYAEGGLAADPGHSNHGWGTALDLDLDARAETWMRSHAHEYGFANDVPREPWHWTFTGDLPPRSGALR